MKPQSYSTLVIVLSHVLGITTLRADTFEDGIAAHDRGDYSTAVKLLRPLAEQGSAPAQTGLGFMYNLGQGVAQDYKQSADWFRKAAEQGNAAAQTGLGFIYQSGQGVPQNSRDAEKWYRLAAEQGSAIAQSKLGVLYKDGDGLAQDIVKAYLWFSLAASEIPEAAEMRDELARQMSTQQLSHAQHLAEQCKTSAFKDCN